MPLTRGDVRYHIDSSKIDHGPRRGVEKRRSSREVQRSTATRFLRLFDFRLCNNIDPTRTLVCILSRTSAAPKLGGFLYNEIDQHFGGHLPGERGCLA